MSAFCAVNGDCDVYWDGIYFQKHRVFVNHIWVVISLFWAQKSDNV